jgi:hypothetical protein
MGLSKTNRILILLVIDTAFFLLELIAGLSALVTMRKMYLLADAIHRLFGSFARSRGRLLSYGEPLILKILPEIMNHILTR